jgi:hypothetical protein
VRLRHADIPDEPTRRWAAFYYVAACLWAGEESPDLSTEELRRFIREDEAVGLLYRDHFEALMVGAPPSPGAFLAEFPMARSEKTIRSDFARIQAPGTQQLPWRRGRDGRLHPARKAELALLVDNLLTLFPEATDRAVARLLTCSHRTVAKRRADRP